MYSSIKAAVVARAEWLFLAFVTVWDWCFPRRATVTVPADDVDIGTIQARSSAGGVPKIIWAFWEGTMSPFVARCLQAFREKNPGYLVVLMNKNNVRKYIAVDLATYPLMNDSIKRFADAVRLHMLAAYGGFWLDASIIMQQPLDIFADKMTKAKAEFFAYTIYSAQDTPGGYTSATIVENWFLGCTKGSAFMQAWRDEFMRINTFESIKAYVDGVEAGGVDLSGMKENGLGIYYLAMHVSAKRVMTLGPGKYRLYLERSEDGAFKPEFDNHWNHRKCVNAVAAGKYKDLPLIKMHGLVRKIVDWWEDPNVFFH